MPRKKAPQPEQRLFTVAQVATMWGCSPNTVRRRISAGELGVIGSGRADTKIALSEIEAYEKRNTRRAPRRVA